MSNAVEVLTVKSRAVPHNKKVQRKEVKESLVDARNDVFILKSCAFLFEMGVS